MDLNIDCHRTAPWANLFTVLSLGLGTRPFASGGRSDRGAHAGGCSAEAGSGGDGWECHVGRRRKRVVAAGAAARLAPAAMSASPDAAGTPPLPQAAATPSGGCVQRLAPRFPCPPASLGRCSTCRALLWEPGEPMAVPAGASTAQPCCWLARSCSCDRSWASGLLCPLAKWSRCLQRQRLSLSPQAGPTVRLPLPEQLSPPPLLAPLPSSSVPGHGVAGEAAGAAALKPVPSAAGAAGAGLVPWRTWRQRGLLAGATGWQLLDLTRLHYVN